MADRQYITVSELNYYISRVLDAEELLHYVPVLGEVSSVSVRNNTCYFTLKDEKAQINITMFASAGKYVPKKGEQVLVTGKVDFYQVGGKLNVIAYDVAPNGIGVLFARLQESKRRLEEEGLFREDHKKPIPKNPRKIGIITSVKGAAIQDILSTLRKHNSRQDVSIIDVSVQGEKCIGDVVTALTYADEYGFDVILLTRGGGSFEDLYSFNDEKIVRTIYAMNTPVITGVGHETDYTLCDYVSDYRAITPTAAAEKVAVDHNEHIRTVFERVYNIKELVNAHIRSEKLRMNQLASRLTSDANRAIDREEYSIKNTLRSVKTILVQKYDDNCKETNHIVDLLDILNPIKLLKRGYFRILHQGILVDDLSKITPGSEIIVYSEKEKIAATVTKKETL